MSKDLKKQHYFLNLYAVVNRFGLLSIPFAQKIFQFSYFQYKKHMEDGLAKMLRQNSGLIADGDIFDVGANIGYTVSVLRRYLKDNHKLHAFEPEKRNFNQLHNNFYKCSQISLNETAVGNVDGWVSLEINEKHFADHKVDKVLCNGDKTIDSVRIVSLDTYASDVNVVKVAFVKIDVQGYEAQVILGMKNIIINNPNIRIYFEMTKEEIGKELTAYDILQKSGFIFYLVDSSGKASRWVENKDVVGDYFDLLAVRAPLILP